MSTCTHCDARVNDSHTLCGRDEALLEKILANIRAHYLDLDTLRTKTARYGDTGKSAIGKTMPIGVDLRFAAVRTDDDGVIIEGRGTAAITAVRANVTTWARAVLAAHPPFEGTTCTGICMHADCARIRRTRPPADNIPAVLTYLQGWVRWIATQPWAGAMLTAARDHERTLQQLVDRPPGLWYAGPCDDPCGVDLYAREGTDIVKCRACGVEYDVAPRRDWLLTAAEDQLADATTIARAVSWLGAQPLTSDRVRKWADRGRLTAHLIERCTTHAYQPTDSDTVRTCKKCRPQYRVGDAIDLLAATATNKGA